MAVSIVSKSHVWPVIGSLSQVESHHIDIGEEAVGDTRCVARLDEKLGDLPPDLRWLEVRTLAPENMVVDADPFGHRRRVRRRVSRRRGQLR